MRIAKYKQTLKNESVSDLAAAYARLLPVEKNCEITAKRVEAEERREEREQEFLRSLPRVSAEELAKARQEARREYLDRDLVDDVEQDLVDDVEQPGIDAKASSNAAAHGEKAKVNRATPFVNGTTPFGTNVIISDGIRVKLVLTLQEYKVFNQAVNPGCTNGEAEAFAVKLLSMIRTRYQTIPRW